MADQPYLAPSLVLGRATLNKRWPARSKAVDGWIGDAAHQGRTSDHNPNGHGSVDAIDITAFGGTTPIHRPSVLAGAMRHPAVHYVIFSRRIWSADQGWLSQVYSGINPHTDHIHVSIRQETDAENSRVMWLLWDHFPTWPLLQQGSGAHGSVADLQAYLNAWGGVLVVDGQFGPKTDLAVRNFQRAHQCAVDGIVGPETRRALFG